MGRREGWKEIGWENWRRGWLRGREGSGREGRKEGEGGNGSKGRSIRREERKGRINGEEVSIRRMCKEVGKRGRYGKRGGGKE